jgi:hypothetical protein
MFRFGVLELLIGIGIGKGLNGSGRGLFGGNIPDEPHQDIPRPSPSRASINPLPPEFYFKF